MPTAAPRVVAPESLIARIIRSISPGFVSNITLSNSGTMRPRGVYPRSPPFTALPGSSLSSVARAARGGQVVRDSAPPWVGPGVVSGGVVELRSVTVVNTREFGIMLASAVIISSFVALSLVPAAAVRLLERPV